VCLCFYFGMVSLVEFDRWLAIADERPGTLITIQRESGWEFGVPIYERLRLRDTLLRSSGDASLLLQSLIDLSKSLQGGGCGWV
jgi:hypothetical protein